MVPKQSATWIPGVPEPILPLLLLLLLLLLLRLPLEAQPEPAPALLTLLAGPLLDAQLEHALLTLPLLSSRRP